MYSMFSLPSFVGLVLLASVPACRKSGEEVANGSGNEVGVHANAATPGSNSSNPSRERNRSMFEELEAIGQLEIGSDEMRQRFRDYLLGFAREQGLSLPQFIAGNLADLIPDAGDTSQMHRLAWMCHGERDEMIELIQELPASQFRTEATSRYGGSWAAQNDLDAIDECYDALSPGHDRTVLSSIGSRAAYLSPDSEKALEWIKGLEYPEEKRIAIDEVGSMFIQGLGTLDDREAFLKELQEIATANGMTPPSGKRGNPLPPLRPPTPNGDALR